MTEENKGIKRGDIVELVDDTIGMVIGFIDKNYFVVLDLRDRKSTTAAALDTDVSKVLVTIEELQGLDFLPKEIKLKDTILG